MSSVYVGTSLFNADRAKQISRIFEVNGVPTTYKWYKHGQVFDDDVLARVGEAEEAGVRDCDLFFMIHPARLGSHCELGMARVLGKHIVILEEVAVSEKKPFYYRPAGHPRPIYRFADEQEAVSCALRLLGVNQP